MHICFIVEGYPTAQDPFMAFARNNVAEIARQGVTCSVIAPQSLTRALTHKVPVRPRYWQDPVAPGVVVEVYQPYYVTLSNFTGALNRRLFVQAARAAYRQVCRQPVDALYAIFWHVGVAAALVDSTKPLFVDGGESVIQATRYYAAPMLQRMQQQLTGAVYVSSKSYEESVKLGLQQPDKPYAILLNGYDPARFRVMDRQAARRELGWPAEATIAVFVGGFVPRKGPLRVARALTEVNRTRPVYSCFIGAGAETPVCPNQLYVGRVDHAKVATYLNAADFFVLPTTDEGCCNAIIEALACGLPVISSNGSFNDDVLTPENSIRIDPMDVQALTQAIDTLAADPERRRALAQGARKTAEALTIEQRARKIIEFLEHTQP